MRPKSSRPGGRARPAGPAEPPGEDLKEMWSHLGLTECPLFREGGLGSGNDSAKVTTDQSSNQVTNLGVGATALGTPGSLSLYFPRRLRLGSLDFAPVSTPSPWALPSIFPDPAFSLG